MKSSSLILVSACFLFALSGCEEPKMTVVPLENPASNKPHAAPKPATESYVLRRTDLLHIEMFRQSEIKVDVRVTQEGKIAMPLIGDTQVAGMTMNQARHALEEKYKQYYTNPQLTITISGYAERVVYVTGYVNRAGPVIFPTEGKLTLTRAIAGAGGLQPRGDEQGVFLTHVVDGKKVVDHYDWRAITRGEKADIELEENDSIYVKDTTI